MKKGKLLSFLILSLLFVLSSVIGVQANTVTDQSRQVEIIETVHDYDIEGASCPECAGPMVYMTIMHYIPIYLNGEIIDFYIVVEKEWICTSCLNES